MSSLPSFVNRPWVVGLIATVLFLMAASSSQAVFVDTTTSVQYGAFTGPGGIKELTAWNFTHNYGAGVFPSVVPGFPGDPYSLTNTGYTLSIHESWFSVTPGTVIDATFAANTTPFATTFPSNQSNPFDTQSGVPFMLAFWLDSNVDDSIDNGDSFGWARLQHNGSNPLTLLDFAVMHFAGQPYSPGGPILLGNGIIAGTTTIVPEPTSFIPFALGAGALLLAARRRRTA